MLFFNKKITSYKVFLYNLINNGSAYKTIEVYPIFFYFDIF